MKIWSSVGIAACLACLLLGCASKPQVLPTTGTHPPLSMDQVHLYQTPPDKYEILGTVTDNVRWDESGNATAGFEELLRKAAAMGANGLLFEADPGQFNLLATAGYKGQFYQVPISLKPKTAIAKAIFVPSQK
jgi:hypothetical protein